MDGAIPMADALDIYMADAHGRPYVRARHDCITFAVDWAARVKGVDYMADCRGAYFDDEGAAALITSMGGVDAVFSSKFGPPRTDSATRGDIGFLEFRGNAHFAICCDGKLWAMLTPDLGICRAHLKGLTVWAIGFAP